MSLKDDVMGAQVWETLIQQITQYYGFDWIATVSSLIWIFMIGDKKRVSFVFAIIASMAWLGFAIVTNSYASMVANTLFIGLNIRAYIKWGQV